MAEVLERFRRADQVIEGVLLPESPTAPQDLVDLVTGEVFPRRTLLDDIGIANQAHEHVHVIRHDYEIAKVVLSAIGMPQTAGHDRRKFVTTQHALAVPSI